jgi:hypothetical protein
MSEQTEENRPSEVQAPAPSAPLHYPPPPPIPEEPLQAVAASFRAPARHPLLGPAVWVFGVLTWAYVVVGELVVQLGLPEVLGALLVLSSTGYAWVVASGLGDGAPFVMKRLVSLALAIALFVTLLFFTVTAFGSQRRAYIAAVTVFLWFVSVVAFLVGRSWTPRERYARSTGDRLRSAAIWTLSVIATLIAMISTMDRL